MEVNDRIIKYEVGGVVGRVLGSRQWTLTVDTGAGPYDPNNYYVKDSQGFRKFSYSLDLTVVLSFCRIAFFPHLQSFGSQIRTGINIKRHTGTLD